MSKKTVDQLTEQDWQKIKELADVYVKPLFDKGRVILICPKTTIGPQELAMIQSLYSRDPNSILCHLLDVAEKGAKNFMASFYVNYGHKSIGDCGNILLAFEGVSMLVAKAIQDSQLYNGQEASTRYMDFSENEFLVPVGHRLDGKQKDIQERWREFYFRNTPVVLEYLKTVYPFENYPGEKESKWEKTLKARTFDIMRGFLPAGASTFFSWWTSISHAGEHLSWLRFHGLKEVRDLVDVTEGLLREVYPASFEKDLSKLSSEKIAEYQERELKKQDYRKKWYQQYYLEVQPGEIGSRFECSIQHLLLMIDDYKDFVLNRPKGQDLPWQIGEAISVYWTDLLDFGSFRDLQRHRAVIQRQGLLTDKFGMHEWYMDNLPEQIAHQARGLIKQQVKAIHELSLSDMEKQYLFPMGMKIPTRVSGSLSKFMYLIELRAQSTVHPTLHTNALHLAESVQYRLAEIFNCKIEDIPMYINKNVGELDLKRGAQDIVKKES